VLERSNPDKTKDVGGTHSARAAAIAAAAALAVLDPKRRGFVVALACTEAAISVARRTPALQGVKHMGTFWSDNQVQLAVVQC
jgi:hypothetical protein